MIIKINSMESMGWALAVAVAQMLHALFAVAGSPHVGTWICVSGVLASTMNLYYYNYVHSKWFQIPGLQYVIDWAPETKFIWSIKIMRLLGPETKLRNTLHRFI